ncbi:MAG: protease modulator HflC [Candidatus Cloacimonetes bacterium]|nr:protease modulator HflC [Candidatus Cloacimonadota bacterium]
MKKGKWFILLAVAIILVVDALYIVDETQHAIVTQFGEPVGGAVSRSGLHIKAPLIQKVHLFEKRILEWDGEPNQIPTADKKFIAVDTFARWRIVDPLLYYESVKLESSAHGRLDAVINGVTRDIIANNTLIEIVRDSNRELLFSADDINILREVQETIPADGDSVAARQLADSQADDAEAIGRRHEIELEVLAETRSDMERYGIEIVDVRIKRINYIESVRRDVYQRMIAERSKISGWYRSTGIGEGDVILGEMERRLQEIESTAYRQVQEIRGEADAEATRIYAQTFNRDPEFYRLWQTLETYKETMGSKNTLIFSTDSDYYRYLKEIR